MNNKTDNNHLKNKFSLACRTMFEVAAVSLEIQKNNNGRAAVKLDRSPVTVADFSVQTIILRAISKYFPDDKIVSEEDSGLLKSDKDLLNEVIEYVKKTTQTEVKQDDIFKWIDFGKSKNKLNEFWTLDPIDGTKGFIRDGNFAISLAYLKDGIIEFCALACPRLDSSCTDNINGELLVAEKGSGTYCMGRETDSGKIIKRSVHVSGCESQEKIRFCESVEKSHSSHNETKKIADALGITAYPVRIDSQAKYAMVAKGQAEAYLRLPKKSYREKIWDHAGGALCVLEAGGKVTDVLGRDLDFDTGSTMENNWGIVATNGIIHDKVIKVIKDLKIVNIL